MMSDLDARTEIRLDDIPELHEQSSAMLDAVHKSGAPVFTFGGALVRVERVDGHAKSKPLAVDGMRHEISKAARCIVTRKTRDGSQYDVEIFPTIAPVRDAMNSGCSPFATLNGIMRHAGLSKTGEILSGTGFDAGTGLYIDAPDLLDLSVPDQPTEAEIIKARETVFELFTDFPFPDRASSAGTIALFLTVLLRSLIDGPVPIFAITAPAPGTGKSLLVQAIFFAVCGELPAVLSETRDSDELQKTLLAALLESPEAIVMDNLNGKIDNGILAAVVTAGRLRGRILGRSEVVDIPVRAPIILTANNPIMSNEIARRSVPIKLEANSSMPWTRSDFRHADLIGYIRETRREIISAGLTLGRAWIKQGRKRPQGKPLGSFESWFNVIGGILETAGIPGLLENAVQFYESADVETTAWTSFLVEWKKSFPVGGVPSRDLVELALKCEIIEEGRTARATQIALGRALTKMQGRFFGNMKIRKLSIVSGLQFWGFTEINQGI